MNNQPKTRLKAQRIMAIPYKSHASSCYYMYVRNCLYRECTAQTIALNGVERVSKHTDMRSKGYSRRNAKTPYPTRLLNWHPPRNIHVVSGQLYCRFFEWPLYKRHNRGCNQAFWRHRLPRVVGSCSADRKLESCPLTSHTCGLARKWPIFLTCDVFFSPAFSPKSITLFIQVLSRTRL